MEAKLFHALHGVSKPSLKEFNEAFAFVSAVRKGLGKEVCSSVEVVLDVAGGHGLIAYLYLLLEQSVQSAVVIDPADVVAGRRGLEEAWGGFRDRSGGSCPAPRYRRECLRTALPAELEEAKKKRQRVLVVACHACQHLSWETVDIAQQYGAHVAVMPCCQSDVEFGGSWKQLAKNLSSSAGSKGKLKLDLATTMDLLLSGRMMAAQRGSYIVKMKIIDPKVSPQNRVAIAIKTQEALQVGAGGSSRTRGSLREKAHAALQQAYRRAHQQDGKETKRPPPPPPPPTLAPARPSALPHLVATSTLVASAIVLAGLASKLLRLPSSAGRPRFPPLIFDTATGSLALLSSFSALQLYRAPGVAQAFASYWRP